ncbi:lysozyme, partial [Escherichia coli]|nr:lysozyme [Escherichia coli]MDN1947634.1 lysozyme [Escherichia coli]
SQGLVNRREEFRQWCLRDTGGST